MGKYSTALLAMLSTAIANQSTGGSVAAAWSYESVYDTITLSSNGQVVRNKVIYADDAGIVGASLSDIIIEDCLIYHNSAGGSGDARGIKLTNCTRPIIRRCETINLGAPDRGALSSTSQSGIYIEGGSDARVTNCTTRRGSSGVQFVTVNNTTIVDHENHDARGPYPRGMAIQWNQCTGVHTATNVSDESIPGTSWNEDSYNVYHTPNVTINGVFIPMQSDGLSGRGLVLEGTPTIGCSVSNMEALHTFNGLSGGFDVGLGNEIEAKAKFYNRYSERGFPGSSSSGSSLCAIAVTFYNVVPGQYTDLAMLFYGIPARTPNGTAYSAGLLNKWYNPTTTGGIAQGTGYVTEQDWTPSRTPVRNVLQWRLAGSPGPDLEPRIGSYWLDGRIGVTIVPGTSILGLLPGRYTNDPTSRTFQWRKNGVDISGATGIDYDVLVGDSGSNIDCVETVSNASGTYSQTTDAVAIP